MGHYVIYTHTHIYIHISHIAFEFGFCFVWPNPPQNQTRYLSIPLSLPPLLLMMMTTTTTTTMGQHSQRAGEAPEASTRDGDSDPAGGQDRAGDGVDRTGSVWYARLRDRWWWWPQGAEKAGGDDGGGGGGGATNWLAVLASLSVLLGLGFGGSLWALFRSLLSQRRAAEHLRAARDRHTRDRDSLQRMLRQKTDQLHHTLSELKHQIDVAKQAIHHSRALKATQRRLQREVAERTEELRAASDRRQEAELKLVETRQRIGDLESEVGARDQQIQQVHTELQGERQRCAEMEAQRAALEQELERHREHISRLSAQIEMARENQQVLEYVLGRFAPELARKVRQAMDLHREQRTKMQQMERPEEQRIEEAFTDEQHSLLDTAAVATALEQQRPIPHDSNSSASDTIAATAAGQPAAIHGPIIEDMQDDETVM